MTYLLRFITSSRRGAGTASPVRVQSLVGLRGRGGPYPWWWTAGGFPTGSEREFALPGHADLGELQELELETEAEGDGWLLDSVVVSGHGASTRFPHGHWLGDSDAADGETGPRQVILRRAAAPDAARDCASARPLSRIQTWAAAVPEKSKVASGVRALVGRFEGSAGEDAFFIAANQVRFALADGVSQWVRAHTLCQGAMSSPTRITQSELGIDAGLFARQLAKGALVHNSVVGAYQDAVRSGLKGSATLLLVDVDLRLARAAVTSLGDSKCVLVRGGKIVQRTVEQEHGFGRPFQLSSQVDARDQPSHALRVDWPLLAGDVLVAATDGLFDNVMESDIAATVDAHAAAPAEAARALVHRAWTMSQEEFARTPFSIGASEAFDLAFSGGKQDDVTCVVARVD